jgi:hypothetical protein
MSATILPSDVPLRNHRNKTFKNMKEKASDFLKKLTGPKTSKIYIGDDIPVSDNTLGIEDIDINLADDKKTGGKRRRTRQKSSKNKRRTRRNRRTRRTRR